VILDLVSLVDYRHLPRAYFESAETLIHAGSYEANAPDKAQALFTWPINISYRTRCYV
jgi:hypothetical protein